MGRLDKTIQKILSGASDKNINFEELVSVLFHFKFEERIKGSHHIFYRKDIEYIINLQPAKDGKAKPYQIKQVRDIVLKYRLMMKQE
jgi:predicted RNA binding protein YcfA (HicA-like mRNA interferase family)